MTHTVAELLERGAHGPAVAAWLGDGLFAAAAAGEVRSATAIVDPAGGITLAPERTREADGTAPDPVLALGRTLLDVFAGRCVRLPADPLLYDLRLAPLLALPCVPADDLRTGALVGLLRRMCAFLPSARPDLAECALVWGRLWSAALRADGRERVRTAAGRAPRRLVRGLAQLRGWSPADDDRLAAYRAIDPPTLRRILGVEHRADGVTDLSLEPLPATDPLELLVVRPLGQRLRLVGAVAEVARGVAALHDGGVSHGAVTSRDVVLADDRVVLDGFVLGDRARLPTVVTPGPDGEEEADRAGLAALVRELVTGDVLGGARRPDRTARYTYVGGAGGEAPALPSSKLLDQLLGAADDVGRRGGSAGQLAEELRPLVARVRGEVVARMAADVARLGPLVLP